MILRCFLLLLLASSFALPWLVQAQEDRDAQIIEEDYRITSLEDRQSAVARLRNQAQELRNAGQIVDAVRTLNRVGNFQIRMFLPDQAVATFQEALKLLDQAPDVRMRIDSMNGLASAYDYLSDCKHAQPLAVETVTLSKENNYIAGEADALLTLSDCQNHFDYALALRTSKESLELWKSIGRKRGMADAYVVIGHDQLAQNLLIECSQSFESALSLYRELNATGQQASVLIYLAYIEYRKGAWQSSLDFHAQALALIDEKAEPYKMGQITGGMAEAFFESGMPDVALTKYQESLEYFRSTKNQRAIMSTSLCLAKAQYGLGHNQEALGTLTSVRTEAEAENDLLLTALSDDYLGRTYYALNDLPAALSHFQAALNGFNKTHNAMEAGRVQALIGRVYQANGDFDEARADYKKALASFRVISDHVNESATLYILGVLELGLNNLDLAEDYLQQSLDVTENIRRSSTSSDLTTAFSANVNERYEAFIECLMRQHHSHPDLHLDIKAFETHELARARSLTELLRATQTSVVAGLDPQLAEREKSLRQSLRVKEDAKVALLGKVYKKEDLSKLEAELVQLEAEYKEVNETIAARFPAYQRITHPTLISLKQIQEQAIPDDNTILLEYSLGSPRSYLWIITRSGFSTVELPGRTEIERLARVVYDSLTASQVQGVDTDNRVADRGKAAETNRAAQIASLSQVLLGPVADRLHHERLLIVADGALQYIPFQALALPASNQNAENLAEVRPLILDHEIVSEPSASTLALMVAESANRKVANKSVAILADPVFDLNDARVPQTNLSSSQAAITALPTADMTQALRDVGADQHMPRLLSSRDEANTIMSIVPWRSGFKAVDFQANRNTVLSGDLAQYHIVHFATHALLNNEHPELSGIVLSMVDPNGQTQNGFLRLTDIYNLRLPVDLVVLSACQTGIGKDVKGEGLIGLTRGFMYAGASGVVASLWKVDDEATAELMKRFYSGLFEKGLTPAAALREAQLALRQQKRWQEPYYWAGFVIQGQYSGKVTGSRFTPAVRLAVIGTGSVILLTVIFLAVRQRRRRVL